MLHCWLTPNETITLRWTMPSKAWDHWARGRGAKSVARVIRAELRRVLRSPAVVADRCGVPELTESPQETSGSTNSHEVQIQLPSAKWSEAIKKVGTCLDRSVGTAELLKALIINSESWRQQGADDTERAAGFYSVETGVSTLTTTVGAFRLGRREWVLAVFGVVAASVAALAGVASALAAWCK